jgi:hypothetical protein
MPSIDAGHDIADTTGLFKRPESNDTSALMLSIKAD